MNRPKPTGNRGFLAGETTALGVALPQIKKHFGEGIHMPKSFWLLSAGLTALATPAYAQNDQPATTAGTQTAAAQPDTNQPDIVITAQGRRQLLQDVPLA